MLFSVSNLLENNSRQKNTLLSSACALKPQKEMEFPYHSS